MMIYLLNDNYLPWCDIEKNLNQSEGSIEFKDLLRLRLEIEYTKRLFTMIPKELINLLKYVLTLKFDEEPNYDDIIAQLRKCKENLMGQSPSVAHQFEWTVNVASRVQRIINNEMFMFEASERTIDKNMF